MANGKEKGRTWLREMGREIMDGRVMSKGNEKGTGHILGK